jgi:single-strand DNA-binding protein
MDGIIVALQGRLGSDAETRFLANGSEVLQFAIAPNDSKSVDGGAEWVRVSVFAEKLDEHAAAKLSKGSECYIEGRLQLGRWEGQDGTQRAGLRVNAWQVVPMGQIGRRNPQSDPSRPRMMPQRMAIPPRGAA